MNPYAPKQRGVAEPVHIYEIAEGYCAVMSYEIQPRLDPDAFQWANVPAYSPESLPGKIDENEHVHLANSAEYYASGQRILFLVQRSPRVWLPGCVRFTEVSIPSLPPPRPSKPPTRQDFEDDADDPSGVEIHVGCGDGRALIFESRYLFLREIKLDSEHGEWGAVSNIWNSFDRPRVFHRPLVFEMTIDATWFRQWCHYTGFNPWNPKQKVTEHGPRPGPIWNEGMLASPAEWKELHGVLHDDLQTSLKAKPVIEMVYEYLYTPYTLIPVAAWRYLLHWYGGGPELRVRLNQ